MSTDQHARILEIHLPADKSRIHEVRRRIEEFIRPYLLSTDDVEWVKVAVSEACANAVCHGSPLGMLNVVRIRCQVDEERLTIEVIDQGFGFAPLAIELPGLDEWRPSGRGLAIISAVMDDVCFIPGAGGTCVRMTKRLANGAGPPPESRALPPGRVTRRRPSRRGEDRSPRT